MVGCRAEEMFLTIVNLRVAYMDVPMSNDVVVEVGCYICASSRLAGRVFATRIISAVGCLGVTEAEKGADLLAVHRV